MGEESTLRPSRRESGLKRSCPPLTAGRGLAPGLTARLLLLSCSGSPGLESLLQESQRWCVVRGVRQAEACTLALGGGWGGLSLAAEVLVQPCSSPATERSLRLWGMETVFSALGLITREGSPSWQPDLVSDPLSIWVISNPGAPFPVPLPQPSVRAESERVSVIS